MQVVVLDMDFEELMLGFDEEHVSSHLRARRGSTLRQGVGLTVCVRVCVCIVTKRCMHCIRTYKHV